MQLHHAQKVIKVLITWRASLKAILFYFEIPVDIFHPQPQATVSVVFLVYSVITMTFPYYTGISVIMPGTTITEFWQRGHSWP